ncbi:hypothetical protein OEZ60_16765 [Defluviimonas sp. WL0024]|uniref:Uncharacterized protein n=2 Tax=Albidovulum TaxID=205889 RepID=A0ABT3J706_9RHOB|nr:MULTISPECIES: hypothetical protein [Defluviimonas]MCU9849654.1 hypothetical protein [Defluviimonas sp. WL0024]MCW3783250.1 hypothetical protein [Defluviimonas salinarum]
MTMAPRRPVNPYLVLVAAILLPGTGQVLNRQPVRGLIFLFFMLLLGGFTLKTAAADVSLVGKFAGGIFVYAMAVFDAYRHARIRAELWHFATKTGSQSA